MERLDKILANHGFGTRKEVRRLVRSGAVRVNGKPVLMESDHVDMEKDLIEVDGEPLTIEHDRHIMMNKAAGYVCSTKEGDHETVFDLISDEDRHKYLGGELEMVGRLDVDTEGLLILTTDGKLNHELTSPRHHVDKTYLVRLEKAVSPEKKRVYEKKLAEGIHIQADGKDGEADCLPAKILWGDESGNTDETVCRLTISEGKFHQVKRMFAALGNSVTHLKRISIGRLHLDEKLAPGEYRDLLPEELELMKQN